MIDPTIITVAVGCGSAIIGYCLCAMFDTNKDDKVTVEEFVQKAEQLAKSLDVDKDGYISGMDLCKLIKNTYLRIKK